VLANVPNAARYRDVVIKSRKFITGPGVSKFISRYLEKVRRSKEPQYIPGTIDLPARRDEYARSALAVEPTLEQAQALANIPATMSMDGLFALAGKPAAVTSRDWHFVATLGVEIRQLWFDYRGIGRATFDFKKDLGWHLQGFIAEPMAFESSMPYRSKAAELALPDDVALSMIQLLSGKPSSIKVSAMETSRRGAASLQYLDTAAELLLQQHGTAANTAAIDAYGWICNVLSELGGRRYARVLASVAKQTSDDKLRRYASQPVKDRADIPATPYVPGTVSLNEQQQKFPPLYPRVTQTRE
jgi:hypothetical protein